MNQRDFIHSSLMKFSFFILTVYFFLYSTTITNSLLQSKLVLVIGLAMAVAAFVIKKKIDLNRNFFLYLLVTIMASTELFYVLFKDKHINDFDNLFLYSLIIIIALNGLNINSYIKISFYTKCVLTLIIIILFSFHAIQETTLARENTIRHSLGFFHPNSLGFIAMVLTIEYLLLYLKKSNWMVLTFITLLNGLIYQLTLSRSSFICSLIVLFAAFLYKYTKVLERDWFHIFMLTFIPIMFLLSAFMPLTYNSSKHFYGLINQLFSGRLEMGYYYLERVGTSLFGRPFPETLHIEYPNINVLLDSAFLRLLIQSGWLIFIIVLVGILYRCYQLIRENHLFDVCVILTLLIFSFFERTTNNIFLCASILVLFVKTDQKQYLLYKMKQKLVMLKKNKVK
ncbi:oligosaccharide repeat unit polymerase [Sporolactobacillus inulinus]|uniref:Polysaccharide polymerase n=1 Tax=Sporolactobacillus inulinus CASD TaxID=1069536 RepID=A0A0U1QQA3_9BACL|nr:oligosaccharide repeat unit polymerase [Sporolactobacillus inulinus]KLI02993.1 hypothetical protein SINU_05120 [Sporolactobacillus inulinus CASD]